MKKISLSKKIGNLSVKQVVKELNRISKENNGLSPEAVVEASKNPDAVFHNQFTWDDKKAAHKFRLSEAASIIKAVVVKDIDGEDKSVYTVKIIDSSRDKEKITPKIFVSEREILLQQVRNTFISLWQRHSKNIDEYEKVWRSIEKQFDLSNKKKIFS